MVDKLAHRYAAWLIDHSRGILALSVVVAIACGFVVKHIPIRTDLTKLLPQTTSSVVDLAAIQKRARPFGTIQILVRAEDPATLDRASKSIRDAIVGLPTDQVLAFSPDDHPLRQYLWDHRFLLAKTPDLIEARDALAERLRKAKLDANPLFIDLDDTPKTTKPDQFEELRRRLAQLERDAKAPPRRISADGKHELLVVQTAFSTSDYDHTRAIVSRIDAIADDATRAAGPGASYGLAGNAVLTLEEHDSVLRGMGLSIAITVLLCAAALLLYYRSGLAVLSMLWALAVGVTITFALAYVFVGHLDMMSAFLVAIVVGNGINAGLILVARYFEELRAGNTENAIELAIGGSVHGTLGATATAAIAYASLVVTDFRGFRHFGLIAAIGMTATWITTYTVLPALLHRLSRRGAIRVHPVPGLGRMLARLMPERRIGLVVGAGVIVTLIGGVIAGQYALGQPFTTDWRDLQSSTQDIRTTQAVGREIGQNFDTGTTLAAQALQAVIAIEDRSQLAPLVGKIEAADKIRPEPLRWLRSVVSLDALVPPDQQEKQAILADIRRLIDDPALMANLDDKDRKELLTMRPPDVIPPIVDADVPPDLIWPFVERGGAVGRLAVVRGSPKLDSFNVHDRLRFAAEVRRLELPPRSQVAGEALVVADIISTMERDTPWMIGFALLGSIIGVVLIVGRNRHAAVTIGCGLAGVVVMIAACAVAGIQVHFVDVIALPITIGIGIDYAVNLAIRDRQEGERGPRYLVSTTGSAVVLCSFTTTIGYASLLLSANGGIRAFGLAALLGELSCITMALLVAPALLGVLRRRQSSAAHR